MDRRSTSLVREELGRVEKKLAAARLLEHQTEERHGREGLAETEAVLEARRTRTGHLEGERERLVAEIGRRTVAEGGWRLDDAEGALPNGEPARSLACGMAGRLRIGPHPLLPERGWLIHDRSKGTVAWVRKVPSPAGAAQILREHGASWDGELLAHSLQPVPEEAEEGEGGRQGSSRGGV
ncbi:MAG TPA: hypothetical protein VGV91_01220 [Rubrobacter sp.]|nr:hypothetical protein [Rubrobacter sp.]